MNKVSKKSFIRRVFHASKEKDKTTLMMLLEEASKNVELVNEVDYFMHELDCDFKLYCLMQDHNLL